MLIDPLWPQGFSSDASSHVLSSYCIWPDWHGCCRFVQGLKSNGAFKVETVILPDGEEHKSLQVLQKVWDKALESRLDRKATFVALGGGVIGDMTGFAAAAYQRGAHFIQVQPKPFCLTLRVDLSNCMLCHCALGICFMTCWRIKLVYEHSIGLASLLMHCSALHDHLLVRRRLTSA